MRVALLSNVNLDLVGKALKVPSETWIPPGYGEWVVHTYEQGAGALRGFDPDQVVVALDGTALVDGVADESVEGELTACLGHVARLAAALPHCRVVVSTLDFPTRTIRPASAGRPEERWSFTWRRDLEELAGRADNVHVLDLARLVSDVGRSGFYSPKMWYLGGQPYAMSAARLIAAAVDEALDLPTRTRRKVMVVDLDNTLWGGVVGEDGPAGLVIGPSGVGAAYRDVQRRLKELTTTGVLLAAVSKNEQADALAGLEDNPQMVLTPGDFVAILAGWGPKPDAIASLAERLNLGLSSFVYLDDNPVEREAVRQSLPEVIVLDFPRDIAALPQVVAEAAAEHFWIDRLTSEDEAKGDQYRQEAARAEFRDTAGDMDDYLRQLDVRISIGEMGEPQRARTAQLTQKTNQFNVLTRRHTPEDLGALAARPDHHIFTVAVADRFGDAGQVAVVMVRVDGGTAHIENLLMSCRVMGRAIEDGVVAAVEQRLADEGVHTVEAAYERSPRNTPVQDLFDRLGYERLTETDVGVTYRREIGSPAPLRRDLHTVTWTTP